MVLCQLPDQLPDFDNLLRIQSHRRFIQNNNLRISQDCLGQSHSLTVTFGQIFYQTLLHIGDSYHFHHIFDLIFPSVPGNFLQLCREFQILFHCHIKIQRRLFRQIANTFFCLLRLLQNIMSVNNHLTVCGSNVPRHNIHGRRFSCAVWAQKAVNLSLFHMKRQVINGQMITILFDQVFYLYQCLIPPFPYYFIKKVCSTF